MAHHAFTAGNHDFAVGRAGPHFSILEHPPARYVSELDEAVRVATVVKRDSRSYLARTDMSLMYVRDSWNYGDLLRSHSVTLSTRNPQ